MFTRTRKNVRNKEYASLFMKVQEVHRVIGGSLSLFLVISMNSFKLKNLGSKREFVRDVLHIPSLKCKKREPQEARVGFAEPKARPSLLVFLMSCSLAC